MKEKKTNIYLVDISWISVIWLDSKETDTEVIAKERDTIDEEVRDTSSSLKSVWETIS